MALVAPRIAEPVTPSRAVPVALTLLGLIAIVDLWVDDLSNRDAILEPLLVVGPLVAATRARPAHVGTVAVIAVLMGALLGVLDGGLGDTDHLVALAAVAVGGALAVAVAQAQHILTGTVIERGAELAAERSARRRADLLARSGELLESPLDPDTMLARVTGLPVPDHADLSIVDLRQADGTLRGAVTNAADDRLAATLRELRERFPLDPDGAHPVAVALRTGQPQLLPRMTDDDLARIAADPEHLELMRRAQYRSAIVLPLTARGRTFGVLSLLRFGDALPFTEDDLALGVDLARHAALALDNARLFHELEATEQRLEAIVGNLAEAVTAMTPDGRMVFANQAAAELAGAASPAALVAEGVAVVDRWTVLDEHGRELPLDAQPLAAALRGEDPEPLLVHAVERATGKDLWLVNRAAHVRDEDGRTRLIVHVSEDVGAMKRQELRERLLSTASKLLGSSLDVAATVDKAAWAAVPELADWARIDLLDERGTLGQGAIAHRDLDQLEVLEEMRRDFPLRGEDDDRGPYGVLRTGQPVLWDRFDPVEVDRYIQAPRHAELLAQLELRSLVIVPLRAGERVIGTLQLATTTASDRVLGAAELDLAEELARRAAIAVEHARLHAARTHIATTLQRSLLPPRLPVIPGLTIAARFRAVGAGSEVGGDFYDLFEGRGGWVVLIGDVTGKGPVAAATTSLARYTMRTVAQYEEHPRAMLERLNTTLSADPDRRQMCTAACVAVRERAGAAGLELEVVRAGHPPPLLVTAAGEVRAVGRAGTLLGAFPTGKWHADTVALAPGDTLVLYTDGVTDTRGTDDRFGVDRLVELLRELGPAEADATAQRIDEALQAFGEQRDDVALLVLCAGEPATAAKAVVHAEEAPSR